MQKNLLHLIYIVGTFTIFCMNLYKISKIYSQSRQPIILENFEMENKKYKKSKEEYEKVEKIQIYLQNSEKNIQNIQNTLQNNIFHNVPMYFFIFPLLVSYIIYSYDKDITNYKKLIVKLKDDKSTDFTYNNDTKDVISGDIYTDFVYFVMQPITKIFFDPDVFLYYFPFADKKKLKEHIWVFFFVYVLIFFGILYIILPENLVYLIVYSIFYYQLYKNNIIKLYEAITLILIVFFLHFLYDLDILSNKMYNFIFYPINIYIISKNFFLSNKNK